MARRSSSLIAFNRGILSRLGLARIDLAKLQMAAETMTNWMPRVLGSMSIRPGTRYIENTRNDDKTILVPFVFNADETALVELSGTTSTNVGAMRVYVDDVLVTRPTVTAAVTNGLFISNITGWTDADESGATSQWTDSGNPFNGWMDLTGDGTNAAIRTQEVTVNETDVEHALSIGVVRGPVTLRVGSTAGAEDYIAETQLDTGTHSIAFTPSGNFHIHLSSRLTYTVRLSGCTIESAGIMVLLTPYDEDDLPNIRYDQSGDVIFVACSGHQQRKIERRSNRSWSFVYYEAIGPFRTINTTGITMTPSGLSGNIQITASKSFFRTTHVGGTMRIASNGQTVSATASAENTFTDPIRVDGAGDQRQFSIDVTGTFTGTVTLQYSVGVPGSWADLDTYTVPTATGHDDGLDNQTIYYRLGIKAGDYGSGSATMVLIVASGSISGIIRFHTYTSATVMLGRVVQNFGGLDATLDWWESDWSGFRGWPSAVSFHEGRLWWAGRDKLWGSISDQFYSFDDDFEGDAGPISRSIGSGPVDAIHWLLSLGRLLIGTAINSAPYSAVNVDGNNVLGARSSSFDEPLTPTNFSIKNTASKGFFIDRSRQRIFELAYSLDSNDYVSSDVSLLTPDLNIVGISWIAVQMKPEIRLHAGRTDGTVAILVFDRAESVICWVEYETDGEVEAGAVLPGESEDQVYYVVKRTIDGGEVRYVEKWALESECSGKPAGKLADAHLIYSGAATTTITGLGHLEGETVVVWGWNTATPFTDMDGNVIGRDMGTFVVSGGEITGLSAAVTDACIGIGYAAPFKGVKLGLLNQNKKITELGLVLLDTHYQGLKYGPSLTELYELSKRPEVKQTTEHHVWESLETDMEPFGGTWENDARLCLRAAAPRPCTVSAATVNFEA